MSEKKEPKNCYNWKEIKEKHRNTWEFFPTFKYFEDITYPVETTPDLIKLTRNHLMNSAIEISENSEMETYHGIIRYMFDQFLCMMMNDTKIGVDALLDELIHRLNVFKEGWVPELIEYNLKRPSSRQDENQNE